MGTNVVIVLSPSQPISFSTYLLFNLSPSQVIMMVLIYGAHLWTVLIIKFWTCFGSNLQIWTRMGCFGHILALILQIWGKGVEFGRKLVNFEQIWDKYGEIGHILAHFYAFLAQFHTIMGIWGVLIKCFVKMVKCWTILIKCL